MRYYCLITILLIALSTVTQPSSAGVPTPTPTPTADVLHPVTPLPRPPLPTPDVPHGAAQRIIYLPLILRN